MRICLVEQVQNIVAISQLTLVVTGFAGHAGTAPMPMWQDALQYLLPALFGALFTDRLLNSPIKLSLSALPVVFIVKTVAVTGAFAILPFGGGYAPILICVATCMLLAKLLCVENEKGAKGNAAQYEEAAVKG